MNIKAFQQFLPIDSRKKITELTSYISSCSPADRLPIELCISHIENIRLREIFFLKCLSQNLYPEKEGFIRSMQKAMFTSGSLVAPEIASAEYAKEVEAEARAKVRQRKKEDKKQIIDLKNAKHYEKQDQPKESQIQTTKKNRERGSKITPFEEYMESCIFAKVRADELILLDGKIQYQQYSLKTTRVVSVKKRILSQIDHIFKLVEDIERSNKTKTPQFHFWPYDDLSYLLGEIERIKANTQANTSSEFPQDGRFILPWKYVLFYDGIMYIEHPNPSKRGTINPFQFRHTNILKSYRDIMPYIESRCPRFDVEAKDGVIQFVHNFLAFKKMIPNFYEKVTAEEDYDVVSKPISIGSTFTKSNFTSHIRIIKSPYISHLSKKQVDKRLIFYLLECINHTSTDFDHDEYGYLFTIKEVNNESTLVFENVTDESRSSIVFIVDSYKFDKAVQAIHRFLASDVKNKRQKIASKCLRINDDSILSISRLIHNDFDSWHSQINYLSGHH